MLAQTVVMVVPKNRSGHAWLTSYNQHNSVMGNIVKLQSNQLELINCEKSPLELELAFFL